MATKPKQQQRENGTVLQRQPQRAAYAVDHQRHGQANLLHQRGDATTSSSDASVKISGVRERAIQRNNGRSSRRTAVCARIRFRPA